MDKKEKTILESLEEAKILGGGIITYFFKDNTKQRTPINKQIFYHENGRERKITDVLKLFEDLAWDLHAVGFSI